MEEDKTVERNRTNRFFFGSGGCGFFLEGVWALSSCFWFYLASSVALFSSFFFLFRCCRCCCCNPASDDEAKLLAEQTVL